MSSDKELLLQLISTVTDRLSNRDAASRIKEAKLRVEALSIESLRECGVTNKEDVTLILNEAIQIFYASKKNISKDREIEVQKPVLIRQGSSINQFDGIQGDEPLDVRILARLLESIVSWEQLGVQLGIKMNRLEAIKGEHHGDLEMCKNKLFDVWLRQTSNPSWRDVVNALESIQENNLADKIKQKFLQDNAADPTLLSYRRTHSSSIDSDPRLAVTSSIVPVLVQPTNIPGSASPATIPRGLPVYYPAATPGPPTTVASALSDSTREYAHLQCQDTAATRDTQNESQLIEVLKAMTIEDTQEIEIDCKVYNADTNKLIQNVKPSPLTRDIKRKTSHRIQEDAMKIGTSLRLEISANIDSYLYIVDIGTSGKISLLLPNEDEPTKLFKANEVYHLPEEDGFQLDGPPGKEVIQVLAFSQKQPRLEELVHKSDQRQELFRDIIYRRKKVSVEEKKGFAQVHFNVYQ